MTPALLLLIALAQDTTSLTLWTAVERALASYPSVAAARAQRERAAADLREAQAAWLPRLTVDATVTRFEEPMVVRPLHGFDPANPPEFDRTLVQAAASLSYTLLDFGIRGGRVRAQRALGGAAEAMVDGAEGLLTARVTNAYLRVVSSREVLAAHDQRLAALAAESRRAGQLLAEGKAARIEVLRVNTELERARADRIAGASQLDMAERELAQLAGVPIDALPATRLESLRLAAGVPADTGAAARGTLVQRARAAAPEVRELQGRADASRAMLSAVKGTRLPEVRLSSGYIDRGTGSGDFDGEWQVGVGVSYPLFTGGARHSAIRRADADARGAAAQLEAGQLASELSVDRALAALRDARARVTALSSVATQSEELVRIERLALDVGSGTRSDYLGAEANLLRARASVIEARHAEISARVELARLTGALSPAWLRANLEPVP